MASDELARMRREYENDGFTEADAGGDPYALFDRWFAEAQAAQVPEPNAMALATSTPDGTPSVRILLLKHLDEHGAVFFTNYESRKGTELATNARAAGVLLWHPMFRQVRIEGAVERISAEESDQYFASRPEGARISANVSQQSRPVQDPDALMKAWVEAEAVGAADRRPDSWGGFRMTIESFEFWQGRPNRLHDRIVFQRTMGGWATHRLQP